MKRLKLPDFFSLKSLEERLRFGPRAGRGSEPVAELPEAPPPTSALVLALINNKGGVGKTTTAVNLAAALAVRAPTLLIDLDSQNSATRALGQQPADGVLPTLADVFRGTRPLPRAIRHTFVRGLDLVAGGLDLVDIPDHLAHRSQANLLLLNALDAVRHRYGYIVLDCAPTFTSLSRNALVAADAYLVPTQPHFLAIEGMKTLALMMERTRDPLAAYPPMLGIALTMVDYRDPVMHKHIHAFRKTYGNKVFDTEVPFQIDLAEAPSRGKSIFEYAGRSHAAQRYWSLSKEVIRRSAALHPAVTLPPRFRRIDAV